MSKAVVRFVGGGLKPTDRLSVTLSKAGTFQEQRDAIVAALADKLDEAAFSALNMHAVLEEEKDGKKSKKPGRVLSWDDTVESLNGSHWIWLVKKPAGGSSSAPPRPPPKKAAAAAPSADTVPPPPPPRPASKKVAASKPPTPTSSAAEESDSAPPPPPPPPPPPRPKKSVPSTPNAGAAIPPPPPPRPVSPARAATAADSGEAAGSVSLPPPPPMPRAKSPQRQPAESAGSLTLAVPPAPPMPTKKGSSRAPSRNVSPNRAANEPAAASGSLGAMTFTPATKALEQQRLQPEPAASGSLGAMTFTPATKALEQQRAPSRQPSRQPSPSRTAASPAASAASPPPRAPPTPVHASAAPVAPQQHQDPAAGGSGAAEQHLLQVQRQLLDDERRRLEDMEKRIAESVERESSRARATLEATYEEQRARSLQQQTAVAEERAELMAKLTAREEQLFEAQSKLINDFQQRAIGGGGADGSGNPAIAELHRANEELKATLERRRKEVEEDRSKTSDEVAQVVKMQAQLMATLAEVQRASASTAEVGDRALSITAAGPSSGSGDATLAIANYDALTRFLDGIGLGKYTATLLKHDVDMATLKTMSDSELQGVGVATIGARKQIRMELAKLAEEEEEAKRGGGGRPSARDAKLMAATGGPVVALTAQQLRRHERILKRFFDLVKEPQLAGRADAIARQFSGQLDALYAALAHRYDICVSTYRVALGSFLRRERLDYLLPALDVICFAYESREAEFAEVVLLEALGVQQQPLTWLEFTAAEDECPPPPSPRSARYSRRTSRRPSVHGGNATPQRRDGTATPQRGHGDPDQSVEFDGAATAGGDGTRHYYYCALVHLSQWTVPRVAHKTDISAVAEPQYLSVPDRGGRLLEANPQAEDMMLVQSSNHRYIAATVALLMRHDPSRLTQFNALRKQYSTPRDIEYARGGGGDTGSGEVGHPLNARAMYRDLCRWYATSYGGGRSSHAQEAA